MATAQRRIRKPTRLAASKHDSFGTNAILAKKLTRISVICRPPFASGGVSFTVRTCGFGKKACMQHQDDGESCFLHGYTAPKQALVSCAASSPVEPHRPLCTLDASVSTGRHAWDVHTCPPGHEVLQACAETVKKCCCAKVSMAPRKDDTHAVLRLAWPFTRMTRHRTWLKS